MQQFTDPSLVRLRAALVPFGVKLTVKKGGAKQTAHELLERGMVMPDLVKHKGKNGEGFKVTVASKSKPGTFHVVWVMTTGLAFCDCPAGPRCSHCAAAKMACGIGLKGDTVSREKDAPAGR